jgi:uncharacterized protein
LKEIVNIARSLKERVKVKNSVIDFLDRFGQWGMVAGAAEGIGAAYCEELARRGMNMIMVDVNEAGMESLAKRLEKAHNIQVKRVVQDLADRTAPASCMKAMEGLDCRLLVYNAAYSRVKPFLSSSPEELDLYTNVNARTPLHLVYDFVQKLKSESKTGGILLMASLAGLWGARFVAAYAATKAFNLRLAEALSFELKPQGIHICACCAGSTATPGYLGTDPARGFLAPNVMQPAKVAAIAIRNLGRKTVIIPGLANQFNYFFLTRILPRSISVSLVNKVIARTYKHVR